MEDRLKMQDHLLLGGRRHHFFSPISLSIALSSIVSAKSRFIRPSPYWIGIYSELE
jgi:hypothetical protein